MGLSGDFSESVRTPARPLPCSLAAVCRMTCLIAPSSAQDGLIADSAAGLKRGSGEAQLLR